MIAHQCPVTEHVSWLSGTQEDPAESTVYMHTTQLCTASLLLFYLQAYIWQNTAAKTDNLMCTISYWHYGNITWGSLLLLTSKANERFKLQRLLCLLALILSRANSSLWHTLGVKNISPSSCSLVSPHSIPFPFAPSSSRRWKGANKNVDPDSLESDTKLVAGPQIWRGGAELRLAAGSCTSHTWQNLLMQKWESAPLEDWGNLSMIKKKKQHLHRLSQSLQGDSPTGFIFKEAWHV